MSHTTPSCDELREMLLEADAAELRGEGSSSVALHVRDCRICAAAALRILSAQQELEDALESLAAAAASPLAVARASKEMRGSAASPAPAADPRSTPVHHRARFRRRLSAAIAPLAAAAVLVLFLLSRDGKLPRLETPQPNVMAIANTPVVNVEAGSDVAVMQTSNPNITVVWYLNRERQ
jgi:hypothetical protein